MPRRGFFRPDYSRQDTFDDTIAGHEMLALPRGVLLRIAAPAFQAECRAFETRLPLQTPCHAQRDTQPVKLNVEGSRPVCRSKSRITFGCGPRQPAAGARSGCVTAMTTRPSIPAKSSGLHV